MTFAKSFLGITVNPALSVLIWLILVLAALYFARKPFHRAIKAFCRVINNALRLTASSVLLAEKRLVQRNREVLVTEGLENAERLVEREFDRINTAVTRDLQGYPALHRQMSEVITSLEEHFNKTADVPPSLPNWTNVIDAIANIKHSGDPVVANMLAEINRSLTEQHKSAIEAYRASTSAHHSLLNSMKSMWRKLHKTISDVGQSVTDLNKRAKQIDSYMDHYEQIRKETNKAVRKLASSSMTQFFISGIVLLIALGGIIINFNLIALPMAEMVGGGSYIGPYKTSDVAGMVIVLLELGMGLFLLESLRITRLFPIIGGLDDKMRVRMVYLALTLLAILAGVESALAFMRDRLIADTESLQQTLTGLSETTMPASKISSIGQMVLGFVIPFALAFVAIPLESFISSSRIVIGIVAAGILRAIAFILRLIGHTGIYLGEFITRMYDLVIFPTVWLEEVIAAKRNPANKISKQAVKTKLFKKAKKPVTKQTIQNEEKEQPV
ncbi:MAG: hypothetical protein SWH54_13825 [Thermodesulfobacteriota bacterium]|nr:hypothetical protein [Thermodesulfobacteriota bacterium]